MKKYVILVGIVALMSSCNDDIYDNIKEFVNAETVYPAGYDQTKVSLMAGYDRVEIYLMGESREENPYLAKAIKTVVKWGEGANDSVSFTPARSWVNVTGLTVAQYYHFQVYTEDEFGNTSAPVTIGGKPFSKADESLLVIADIMVSANTMQAVVTPTLSPESYEMAGGTYSLNGETTAFTDPRVVLLGLAEGEIYSVKFTYNLVPVGVLDTVPITYDVDVKTMTQVELDAYINLTNPFPPIVDGKIGNPYYVTSATPFVFSGGAYDLGGVGKATNRVNGSSNNNSGEQYYRQLGGDYSVSTGGADYNAINAIGTPGLVGVGWMGTGDWWVYTVEVVDAGVYKLEYNRAMYIDGCFATLTFDNLDLLGLIPITNNRNWSNYEWLDPQIELPLTVGKHKFKWTNVSAYHNFGGLRLTFLRP